MAAFINNDITTAGLIVLAKGVAGQKINYTKIVLGDGYLEEGQTPRTRRGQPEGDRRHHEAEDQR